MSGDLPGSIAWGEIVPLYSYYNKYNSKTKLIIISIP
jgi:hypothetical protein